MTNLDSILKSRDMTLPTKVRLVKALVFLVVMYGCESWTDSMDMNLGKFQETMEDTEALHAIVFGVTKN